MRRRKRHPDSSLELLLDTMTNAFGGVLFLAILISVQLRQRSFSDAPQAAASQRADVVQTRRDVARLSAEKEMLEGQLARQAAVVQDYTRQSDQPALQELAQLEVRQSELASRKKSMEQELERLAAESAASTRRVEETTGGQVARRQELAAIRAELEAETKKRTISGSLPRQRRSYKKEVGIVFRYGRIYRPKINDVLNHEDFFLKDDDGAVTMSPKPYRGLALRRTEDLSTRFGALLNASPQSDYVAVAAWPDSFADFQELKQLLVTLGFEYRLVPVEEGEEIGTGAIVPMVQ